MSLPKKVKIGGFWWKVKINGDIAEEGRCFGSTHYKTQTLYLDPDTTETHQKQVLLHEILHAIVWQVGLEKRFTDKDIISEENVIGSLSHTLYQVLKENKLDF